MRSTPRPKAAKNSGKDAPAHAVVEVVDEPGLRGGEEVAVAERGEREDLPEAQIGCGSGGMVRRLQPDVSPRVAHEQDREERVPAPRSRCRDRTGSGPQPVARGEIAGEEAR